MGRGGSENPEADSTVLLDVPTSQEVIVMSTWLPILPINEDKMNELVLANRAADWSRLKALVLDSVSSPITRRVYNLGLMSSSPGTARNRGQPSPKQP